jgi:segregation and condensation protein A
VSSLARKIVSSCPAKHLLANRSTDHHIQTAVFDGPLDLLLYLIRRDGVDVREIPIAHITTEYLAVLHRMREMDLSVAGEFLVMASTLCQLKSRELLPRDERELEEEEEDPKERLVRRLIEYERFKEAAEELALRNWLGRDLFARPRSGAEIERPLARDVEALALAEAFSALVRKAKMPAPKHEITLDPWSLVQGVEWLLDTLPQGQPVELQDLFMQLPTRSQRVQTFMSVLEMARIQLVDVEQSDHLGPVAVTCLVDAKTADLSSIQDAEQGDNLPAIKAQNAISRNAISQNTNRGA